MIPPTGTNGDLGGDGQGGLGELVPECKVCTNKDQRVGKAEFTSRFHHSKLGGLVSHLPS